MPVPGCPVLASSRAHTHFLNRHADTGGCCEHALEVQDGFVLGPQLHRSIGHQCEREPVMGSQAQRPPDVGWDGDLPLAVEGGFGNQILFTVI